MVFIHLWNFKCSTLNKSQKKCIPLFYSLLRKRIIPTNWLFYPFHFEPNLCKSFPSSLFLLSRLLVLLGLVDHKLKKFEYHSAGQPRWKICFTYFIVQVRFTSYFFHPRGKVYSYLIEKYICFRIILKSQCLLLITLYYVHATSMLHIATSQGPYHATQTYVCSVFVNFTAWYIFVTSANAIRSCLNLNNTPHRLLASGPLAHQPLRHCPLYFADVLKKIRSGVDDDSWWDM